MGFKERFGNIALEQKQERIKKEFQSRTVDYYKKMIFWHQATLEFLSQPIEISDNGKKFAIDFSQGSAETKAKQIEYILNNKKILDGFYSKACLDTNKKTPIQSTNCVTYATFVATFSQWMNPQNDTTLSMGIATISHCPDKKRTGTQSDHFWVEVNGQIFDNSNKLDGYSYTDLKPLMRSNDILSGNFQFEKVN